MHIHAHMYTCTYTHTCTHTCTHTLALVIIYAAHSPLFSLSITDIGEKGSERKGAGQKQQGRAACHHIQTTNQLASVWPRH